VPNQSLGVDRVLQDRNSRSKTVAIASVVSNQFTLRREIDFAL